MGKSRKDYEKYLNSISPDRDDERWIIGGKNRYCGRENYGTMIKRYDPIGFNVGYREWVEQPEEILRSFDFTVAKMAYYKEPKYEEEEYEEEEDDYFPFSSASIVAYEYKLLYHEKFFEHLHMKRLVIDENIPFPVSTWERSYRYKGYGYNMCRETKKKLLQALKGVNVEEEDVSLYATGGWD